VMTHPWSGRQQAPLVPATMETTTLSPIAPPHIEAPLERGRALRQGADGGALAGHGAHVVVDKLGGGVVAGRGELGLSRDIATAVGKSAEEGVAGLRVPLDDEHGAQVHGEDAAGVELIGEEVVPAGVVAGAGGGRQGCVVEVREGDGAEAAVAVGVVRAGG